MKSKREGCDNITLNIVARSVMMSGFQSVDVWRQRDVKLTTPESSIDVQKYAKKRDKSKLTMDNTPVRGQ